MDYKGEKTENDSQGQPADLQHVKTYYHTHLKFGGTSYCQLHFY